MAVSPRGDVLSAGVMALLTGDPPGAGGGGDGGLVAGSAPVYQEGAAELQLKLKALSGAGDARVLCLPWRR